MFVRSLRLLPLLYAVPAAAAPVSIAVQGPDGQPLAGAVVSVEIAGQPAPTPHGPYSVEQRDIQFQPRVLIVPVGAVVAFPNRDKVRHHVYSFSKPKKFELKLYGREEARTVTFDKPGAVALGCNIHDTMSGVVYVAPTAYARQTDADGRVAWADVPAGQAVIRVWHPSIRAPGNTLSQTTSLRPAGFTTKLTVRR